MASEKDIKRALELIGEYWQMQNDELDRLTKFVYKTDKLDFMLKICKEQNIDENYALHRWYNFNCARSHENIFIKFGAKKEQDPYHKTIDFYLFDVPFDLKTTCFPKAIKEKTNYDLTSRTGKNNLILWLYTNQSKQSRFHLENRLFIVCENLKSKSNFEMIENKVSQFINYSKQNGFNKILFTNKTICSDIIWIPNENQQA